MQITGNCAVEELKRTRCPFVHIKIPASTLHNVVGDLSNGARFAVVVGRCQWCRLGNSGFKCSAPSAFLALLTNFQMAWYPLRTPFYSTVASSSFSCKQVSSQICFWYFVWKLYLKVYLCVCENVTLPFRRS